MFGKKILSIVGLLFLGSQVSKVSATCDFTTVNGETGSEACTVSGCTNSEYGYHFVGKTDGNVDNVIVKVTGESACTVATLTGEQTLVVNDISSHAITNKDNDGGSNPTTTVESGSYIVLNNSNEIINDLVKDEYCVDATSKIVSTRVENYCDGGSNGCDKYFTCVAGVCTDTTDDRDRRQAECDMIAGTNCDDPDLNGDYYYIVKSSPGTLSSASDLVDTTGAGKLFKCTISGGTHRGCSEVTNVAGYFKNNHAAHTDIPYIKCTLSTTSTNTCVALKDVSAETETTCVGHSTSIITTDSGKTYKDCNNQEVDDSAVSLDNAIGAACNANGDLINNGGYKLCINDSTGSLSQIPLGVASYFVDAGNESAFSNKVVNGHFVVVDIDVKNFILNRDAQPKKYRYAKLTTREIKEKGDDVNMCDANATPSLKTTYGHEFEITKQPLSEDATNSDYVNYYKDNNSL